MKLTELPHYLYDRFKNETPGIMAEKTKDVLGITYSSLKKRVDEGRLHLDEIVKLSNYMGLKITINVNEVSFDSTEKLDYRQRIVDLETITKLQAEVMELRQRVNNLT